MHGPGVVHCERPRGQNREEVLMPWTEPRTAFRFLLGSQPTCENDPEPVWLYDWVSLPWLFSQAGGASSYPMLHILLST